MTGIGEIKRSLAAKLAAQVPEADFVSDESGRFLYEGLSRPLVCVSLSRIEARETALGNYVGMEGGAYGRKAEVTVRFEIFCGEPDGAGRCGEVFDALCDTLLFEGEEALREISCGAAGYLVKREAYQLEAQAKYGVLLTRGKDAGIVSGFRLEAAPAALRETVSESKEALI